MPSDGIQYSLICGSDLCCDTEKQQVMIDAQSELLQATQYQAQLGHEGSVLCVDGSAGLDWIVSGGEDCTARLWQYSPKSWQCYRLLRVWRHRHPQSAAVLSTTFAGSHGPAITGTELGDIFIMDTDSNHMSRHNVSDKPISHLKVKKEAFRDMQSWLVLIAAGSIAYLKETSRSTRGQSTFVEIEGHPHKVKHGVTQMKQAFTGERYECTHVSSLRHRETLIGAMHIPSESGEGAAVATCTAKGIYLWSRCGMMLHTIKEPDGKDFVDFHLAHRAEGWLCAASGHQILVWPLINGTILAAGEDVPPREDSSRFFETEGKSSSSSSPFIANSKDGSNISPIPPTTRYKVPQGVEKVVIDPECKHMLIQRGDKHAEIRRIEPESNDTDFVSVPSSNCPHLLRDSATTLPHNLFVIEDIGVCTKMRIRHMRHEYCADTKGEGKNLTVGLMSFTDGAVRTYDLGGTYRGLHISTMRSRTLFEVWEPIFLRLFHFAQMISFAFGPATSFPEAIRKPAHIWRTAVFMDYRFIIDIDPRDLFLPELYVDLGIQALLLVIIFSGIQRHLTNMGNSINHWHRYKQEEKANSTCGPCHLLAGFLRGGRRCMDVLVFLCATVVVVPMMKVIANAFDCEHPSEGEPFLAADSRIQCFSDLHLKLMGMIAILLPAYIFFFLIPHAAVDGDTYFMARRLQMIRPWEWPPAARRKATLMYCGPLHPQASSVFFTRIVEVFSKVFLSSLFILTSSRPIVQTVGVALCGLMNYVFAMIYPPLVNKKWNYTMQGLHLLTFLCMASGTVTVLCPKHDVVAYMLVLLSFGISFTITFVRISQVSKSKDQMRVERNLMRLMRSPRKPQSPREFAMGA